MVVVVGRVSAPPVPSAPALRRHDAVIRRLARAVPAVLPIRFGTAVADLATLDRLLAPRAPALRRALARVKGREQMTLRVFGTIAPAVERPAPLGRARHPLSGRAAPPVAAGRARRRAAARRARRDLIRDERVEPSEAPPLLASVYHLVDRGHSRAYRRAVKEVACRLADVRVVSSGPWAPYAFAPDAGD